MLEDHNYEWELMKGELVDCGIDQVEPNELTEHKLMASEWT